jgi:hypothetical protein
VTRYISGRADAEKAKADNQWMVMRWQSTMIANMISGKRLQPRDLFTLDGESETPRIDPNSEQAKAVFDKMDEVYKRKLKNGNR